MNANINRVAIARVIRTHAQLSAHVVRSVVDEIVEAVTPIVEMVWIVERVGFPTERVVFASARRVREEMSARWSGEPHAHQWRLRLGAWDGLAEIYIGGYRITCSEVSL